MVGTLGPEDDYTEVARKIAGPLPVDQATQTISALRAVLEAVGMQVIDESGYPTVIRRSVAFSLGRARAVRFRTTICCRR